MLVILCNFSLCGLAVNKTRFIPSGNFEGKFSSAVTGVGIGAHISLSPVPSVLHKAVFLKGKKKFNVKSPLVKRRYKPNTFGEWVVKVSKVFSKSNTKQDFGYTNVLCPSLLTILGHLF